MVLSPLFDRKENKHPKIYLRPGAKLLGSLSPRLTVYLMVHNSFTFPTSLTSHHQLPEGLPTDNRIGRLSKESFHFLSLISYMLRSPSQRIHIMKLFLFSEK